MLGWFRALLPREDKFFDLFERHSRILVEGAEALQKLLDGGEGVEQHCRKIVELEDQADEITREVLLAVRMSFITPFDRGDIKDLIQSMDDAIDMMNKVGANVTRLGALAEEITKVEERADGLHDAGLKELFKRYGKTDAMAWLVGSELYGQLEKVVDRFEDVANEISGIVIENV
jgi:uncharacterized protein Yka (UPF0111/DUF47 family)